MSYAEKKGYYKNLFIIAFIALGILIVFATYLGVANISFLQTTAIILRKIPILNKIISSTNVSEVNNIIIFNLRLPRILMAALVGTGLSVVGTAFQGMFKNPMAEPYVLGVSSGAALGATIAIILGLQSTIIIAFLGAISTVFIVYQIARVGRKVPTVNLLLSGVSVSFFLSSMISILMIFNRDKIDQIVFWLMGSVSATGWDQVIILFVILVIGISIIIFFSKDLNLMLLGDEVARTLGIEVEKVKIILLITSSLVVAAVVSFSGIIGFVGLIIPHAVRMVLGSDNRVVIPFSAIVGAMFMIICDTLARTVMPPAELPVGAITALFGAPFFMYLLNKSKKKVL